MFCGIPQTPQKLYNSTFRELISYLVSEPDYDELAKVRAIFRWVTSVDVFSLNVEETAAEAVSDGIFR